MDNLSTEDAKLENEILKATKLIIQPYEEGRKDDLKLDPWLDPEMQIYHVVDRHGFIRDKHEQSDDNKKIAKEARRCGKWIKVCNDWPLHSRSRKMHERVYKGVPLAVRGRVWWLLMGVENNIKKNWGVYEQLKEAGKRWSMELKQIDMDVNRTYRDHIMFRKKYDVKQQALFNILVAYSVYDSEVSYCQGMSQIVAVLLMFLNEEEAFWAFVEMMVGKKHRMHGFFILKFPKLHRYQDHFNKVLKKVLPRLKKHLDKHEMFPNLYTVKWFMQCFLDRLPFSLSMRFWDIYMLEGEKILISMAVTVMKVCKDTLIKLDMEGMMEFLTSKIGHFQPLTDDKVVSLLRSTYEDLQRMKIAVPALSKEQDEEEGVKKSLGQFDKPSLQEMAAMYVEKRDNETREERVEIPADGGKEHLPFTSHDWMADCDSGSDDIVDAGVASLKSSSDLQSPATSLTSPAHHRLINSPNDVSSSSSSMNSQISTPKATTQTPLELLRALNDMLPPIQTLHSSTHSTKTVPRHLERRWATTVCTINNQSQPITSHHHSLTPPLKKSNQTPNGDLHITINHQPSQYKPPCIQSQSIRSRLSLHNWPPNLSFHSTTLPSKNSVSLTPITVLHLKSPFNNTSEASMYSPDSTSSSNQTSFSPIITPLSNVPPSSPLYQHFTTSLSSPSSSIRRTNNNDEVNKSNNINDEDSTIKNNNLVMDTKHQIKFPSLSKANLFKEPCL